MSGCTNTNETLSLCEHGIPVKLGCMDCNENKLSTEAFGVLLKRIEDLEDLLKNEIIIRKDLRDYCFDRLGSAINSPKNIDIYSRINELELLTNALKDKYNSMCAPSLRKEPYKCPNCEGEGGTVITGTIDTPCISCEGKGIVWS